ncbi:hypothetical protein [Nocardia higoensis]|uniref:hypothetical protein n=1 Tax=Nocardia higoensis TaxID=228599 RepID=UPI001E3A871C|nr:hypothetical protein [Nocardia higoensis]
MIGKFEANKDLIQELTSSGARHVGNIATIITATVADVTREIGEWVTDAIEMNEAAHAARRDAKESAAAGSEGALADPGPVGADAFDLLDAGAVESGPAEPGSHDQHRMDERH